MQDFFKPSNYKKFEKYGNFDTLVDLPMDCLPLPEIKGTMFWRSRKFPFDQDGRLKENLTNKTMTLICERDPKNKYDLHYRIGKLSSINETSIILKCYFLRKANTLQNYREEENTYKWIKSEDIMNLNFKRIIFLVILEKIDIHLIKKYFNPFKLIEKGTELFYCNIKEWNPSSDENKSLPLNFSKNDVYLGTLLYTFELKKDIYVLNAPKILINAFFLNTFQKLVSLSSIFEKKQLSISEYNTIEELTLKILDHSNISKEITGILSEIEQKTFEDKEMYESGNIIDKGGHIVPELLLIQTSDLLKLISREKIYFKNNDDLELLERLKLK